MSDPYNCNGPSERVSRLMQQVFLACCESKNDVNDKIYLVNPAIFQPLMARQRDEDKRAAMKRAYRSLRARGESRIQAFVERRLNDLRKPFGRLDRVKIFYQRATPSVFNWWRTA